MASAFSHAPLTDTDMLTSTTHLLKIIPNFRLAKQGHEGDYHLLYYIYSTLGWPGASIQR